MIVCSTIAELRAQLTRLKAERAQPLSTDGQLPTVGFVPTMGYLHAGHASLLQMARATCAITVLSIFVNPLQFAVGEDLAIYPRDEARDLQTAETQGTDLVFMPSAAEMYPDNRQSRTLVQVSGVSERLCGAVRPGHFVGVATVVSKLLHIVQPDRAFFGLKDAQQVAVIEQMVRDLNMPVEIVPCPTVREADGLALSSRNVYLSVAERAAAPVISRALYAVDDWLLQEGEQLTFADVRTRLHQVIGTEPLASIDYIQCLAYPSLTDLPDEPCRDWLAADPERRVLLAVAVKFGKTRLIDNRLLGGGRRV